MLIFVTHRLGLRRTSRLVCYRVYWLFVLALHFALWSCVSLPGKQPSNDRVQMFSGLWERLRQQCLRATPADLAGSVLFGRSLVPFEAVWSGSPETLRGALLSPLGSELASFRLSDAPEEALTRTSSFSCKGRCPKGLNTLLEGLGARGFKALVCGGPALLTPLSNNALLEDNGTMRWTSYVRLFQKNVTVATEVTNWMQGLQGKPFRVRSKTTSGFFASTILTADWSGCAEAAAVFPRAIKLDLRGTPVNLQIDETFFAVDPSPESQLPCKI